MKKIKLILVFILLALFMANTQAIYADSKNTPKPVTSAQTNEQINKAIEAANGNLTDNDKGWLSGMFNFVKNPVDEITNSIKKIFDKGISFILDLTIGSILQGMYNSLAWGMSKWLFLTPKLIGFKWINKLWWMCLIIGLMATIIGMIFTSFNVVTGRNAKKGKEFNSSQLLLTLLISVLGCFFSLFIADTVVNFENRAINSLTRETLYSQYQTYKQYIPSMEKNLKKEQISYDSFTGDVLCRMSFGLLVKEDGSGRPTSLNEEPVYKSFLDQSSAGTSGLFSMCIVMITLSLCGLMAILKHFTIGFLAGTGPLYWSYCTFSGNTDPAWGWVNLFARSVALSIPFDLAWVFATYITSSMDEFFANGFIPLTGAKPILASILFLIALIISIFFWFKWVFKAFSKPLTLAGAEARDSWGKINESFGKQMEGIGARYGISKLQYKGGEMQALGKEHRSIAQEKLKGNYDWNKGKEKDRLGTVKQNFEKKFIHDHGIVAAGKIKNAGENIAEIQSTLKPINSAGHSSNKILDILGNQGFKGVMHKTEEGNIVIDEDHIQEAKSILENSFALKHLQDSILDNKTGIKVAGLDGDRIPLIERNLKEKGINYQKLYDVSIDPGSVDEAISNIDSFQEFCNKYSNITQEDQFGSLPGYSFSLTGQTAKMAEKLFERNNIRYLKNGEKLIVNASDFDSISQSAPDIRNTLESFKTNPSGYNSLKSHEFNKINDSLKSLSVKYGTSESLWMSKEHKEDLKSSLVKIEKDNIENSGDIECISFHISNNDDFKGIRSMLKEELPKGALLNTENVKKNLVYINNEYEAQAKKKIEEYFKFTPYYEESGYFYYRDSSTGIMTAHLSKPEKGRLVKRR